MSELAGTRTNSEQGGEYRIEMKDDINGLLFFSCRTLDKTLVYLDVFARFKDEENIKAVERLLNSHTELEMFERSQLGKSSQVKAISSAVPSFLSALCYFVPFPRTRNQSSGWV